MIFLVDHNIEGYALILLGTLTAGGWIELLPIQFTMFGEIGLPVNSSDRTVWRFAQANQMILLTANRNMKGTDSIEQTIREENTEDSLPIVIIGSVDRFTEFQYREQCSLRLVAIVLDIENYRGAGRLFIP